MDREKWRLYVEDLKKRGLDSIKPRYRSEPAKEEEKKDTRLPKILHIAHHTFKRFTELFPAYQEHLPSGGAQYPINVEAAKKVRKMMKTLFKTFLKTKRIILPFKTVMGKFRKHGAVDCLYFKSPDGIVFTLIREKGKDIMVTCGRPPKERQKEHEPDPSAPPDPTGQNYLKDVTGISVPYLLREWNDYDPSFELIPGLAHPVRFRKEGEPEESEEEEEP